ncbi:MAG: hypothetical protein JWL62_461 [Hyphomicrobiales bacterium]|nr:hypothetical protein [Hyphomicrobiales bacterium]
MRGAQGRKGAANRYFVGLLPHACGSRAATEITRRVPCMENDMRRPG